MCVCVYIYIYIYIYETFVLQKHLKFIIILIMKSIIHVECMIQSYI